VIIARTFFFLIYLLFSFGLLQIFRFRIIFLTVFLSLIFNNVKDLMKLINGENIGKKAKTKVLCAMGMRVELRPPQDPQKIKI
jgi:hypothetical protein